MKSIFIFLFCLTAFCAAIEAAEPVVWEVNTRAEVMRGDARGVSVSDNGTIVLAPRLNEVFNTQQSFVWSSAFDAAGNVFLGTGNDGRIFRVGANNQGALFFDSNELDVTALAIGRDNSVYAATSPDGKVYRIDGSGKGETFFDPADKYIWSLAFLPDGSLAVGTGENGKIYRVRAANATPESSLFFDSSETHIISLTTDKQGNLIAGTDSNGLVLRISGEGKAFALLDAPLREIHELSVAPDGSIYALALSETALASSSGSGGAASGANVVAPAGANVSSVSITVMDDPNSANATPQPTRSRNDLTNAKSAVFRILPDGASDILWSSTTVTGFSLTANPNGNGAFVGTSDKGRIYSVTNDGRETLLLQSNEGQVSTLKSRGNEVFATSSNGGKLYRFGGESVAEGTYESSVRDARSSALWGRIWWRANGSVALQTRSGNTEKPDQTWSDWSAVYQDQAGAQIASPRARFLQWRAVLRGAASNAASLTNVSVSYLPRNIAPEVLSIQILPTNVGLQSNVPPPSDPNIENSGLDPQVFGQPANVTAPPRRLYQRGARSLIWTAEDRNGDRIKYSVFYRAANEQMFRLLRENLRENFFTIDGAALADGRYLFRIVASDEPSNPAGMSLTGERISEPVDVDNTPPAVTSAGAPQISGERVRVAFEAADAAGLVQRAEFSIDGKEWQTVYPEDGIADSPRERFTVDVPVSPGEHTISFRAFDANGNAGSARVSARR